MDLVIQGESNSDGGSLDEAEVSLGLGIAGSSVGGSLDEGTISISGTASISGNSPGGSLDEAGPSVAVALSGNSSGGSSDEAEASGPGVDPIGEAGLLVVTETRDIVSIL